jgi:hypothetical protein
LAQDLLEHPGQAFRDVVPVAMAGAGALIVLHLILTLLARRAAPVRRKRWSLWERLVYLALLLSIAVLGGAAFYSVIRFGVMDGWLLFAHMIGAGAFVVVLPLIAIAWAEANRFGDNRGEQQPGSDPPPFFWFAKLMFWMILVGGWTTASTMLVSMLSLFGSEGLRLLLDIHRYSGLVVVVAAVLHFYGVWLQRLGWR